MPQPVPLASRCAFALCRLLCLQISVSLLPGKGSALPGTGLMLSALWQSGLGPALTVAAAALAETMAEMSPAEALNILYKKTLKYIFSTIQATWPVRLNRVRAHQKRRVSLVFMGAVLLCFFTIITQLRDFSIER